MGNKKIKVAGYSQSINYDNGISYRQFDPNLTGLQLTNEGGTPLFTMGNFSITTNMDPKTDKTYNTNPFSPFISLDTLNLSVEESESLLSNNDEVILNLDKSKLNYYALFGSLTEYIRVTLEDIIIKWPASLYVNPVAQTSDGITLNGYTYEDYTYNSVSDISKFKINTTFLGNKFDLNFLENGNIIDTYNSTNDLRNVTINYKSYVILRDDVEYPVIEFTSSTYSTSDYVYLNVKGDPFSGQPTSYKTVYHIKPSKVFEETFFNALPSLSSYLLNRRTTPKYTAKFNYPTKSEQGVIIYVNNLLTWPVSDGYNIDFDTTGYIDYVTKLIDISTNNDLYSSNLMNRFLVSESISAFDTAPVHLSELDQDMSGQKMNKTLQLYGRMFDDINNFITGIGFANTVSYNKEDNTPDTYLKNIAKVMGWDLISSIMENDLLSNYITTDSPQFSGESVGLTPVEADIELWRRIILNTPWIWKSKGARKSVEFLLRFIGVPEGLVKFNEYIYLADGPIDIDLFRQILILNNLGSNTSIFPIDEDGYPNPLPDTPDMYFQNYGKWYRETSGSGSTVDILTGNNAHIGPYDGGFKYINQFERLIPNFSAVTISSQTTTTNTVNLFTNNQLGTYDSTTVPSIVDTVHLSGLDGEDLSDCYVFSATAISDVVSPRQVLNGCGCPYEGNDNILSICVSKKDGIFVIPCADMINTLIVGDNGLFIFQYNQYNQDGTLYPYPNESIYTTKECCSANKGTSAYYTDINKEGTLISSGYVCCDESGNCGCTIACSWLVEFEPIMLPEFLTIYDDPRNPYLDFIKLDGSKAVVTPDGCNCLTNYTIKVPNITDPYTGEVGFGCKVTEAGLVDLQMGTGSVIVRTYQGRRDKKITCNGYITIGGGENEYINKY